MASKLSYLQKYLSSGETLKGENGEVVAAKKKKKKRKDRVRNFTIVDGLAEDAKKEDEDNPERGYKDKGVRPKLKTAEDDDDEDELSYRAIEDRPQIAGFVDERPEVVIMKERRFTTTRFKAVVKSDDEDEDAAASKEPTKNILPDFPIKEEPRDEDEDPSPPRRHRHDSSDTSPPRRSRKRRHDSSDSDNSPPRRSKAASDSDNSPPRRRRAAGTSGRSPTWTARSASWARCWPCPRTPRTRRCA